MSIIWFARAPIICCCVANRPNADSLANPLLPRSPPAPPPAPPPPPSSADQLDCAAPSGRHVPPGSRTFQCTPVHHRVTCKTSTSVRIHINIIYRCQRRLPRKHAMAPHTVTTSLPRKKAKEHPINDPDLAIQYRRQKLFQAGRRRERRIWISHGNGPLRPNRTAMLASLQRSTAW